MRRGRHDLARRLAAALLLLLLLAALPDVAGRIGTPGTAQEATLLYPDLKTLLPSELHLERETIRGEQRWVLRFTNTIWNAGAGPLELRGNPNTGRLRQRLFDDAGGFFDRPVPKGAFVFHPRHDHWHFTDFADYILRERNRKKGGRLLRRSTKTSFCIFDNTLVDQDLPGSPDERIYTNCDRDIQGLSVGWGDTYRFDLADQLVRLGKRPLPDGRYVLRSVADPRNLLGEGGNGRPRDNKARFCFALTGRKILPEECPPPKRARADAAPAADA